MAQARARGRLERHEAAKRKVLDDIRRARDKEAEEAEEHEEDTPKGKAERKEEPMGEAPKEEVGREAAPKARLRVRRAWRARGVCRATARNTRSLKSGTVGVLVSLPRGV